MRGSELLLAASPVRQPCQMLGMLQPRQLTNRGCRQILAMKNARAFESAPSMRHCHGHDAHKLQMRAAEVFVTHWYHI